MRGQLPSRVPSSTTTACHRSRAGCSADRNFLVRTCALPCHACPAELAPRAPRAPWIARPAVLCQGCRHPPAPCHFSAGATHTRFAHSLGVAHRARELGARLRERQPELAASDRDLLLLEVAGLCHDLGHVSAGGWVCRGCSASTCMHRAARRARALWRCGGRLFRPNQPPRLRMSLN